MSPRTLAWLKGLLAGTISGAAGGVVTGFAAIGIDPEHFNLTVGGGLVHTLEIAGIACVLHAVLGAAMYLQRSPLPNGTPNVG